MAGFSLPSLSNRIFSFSFIVILGLAYIFIIYTLFFMIIKRGGGCIPPFILVPILQGPSLVVLLVINVNPIMVHTYKKSGPLIVTKLTTGLFHRGRAFYIY